MKHSFFLLLAVVLSALLTMACSSSSGHRSAETTVATTDEPADVEVIYFHNKQRCATCIAIENETQALFKGELAQLADSGRVRLRVVDFSTPEGKPIAQRYKVTFSSLFVVAHPGQDEQVDDLTRFAFANARSNTEAFRLELKTKVLNALQ